MARNEDFFGIKKENVQIVDDDFETEGAKGGSKFRRGGGGSSSAGKILGICIVISLVFSLVCSWFMVDMLGSSKSSVNNVIKNLNGLITAFDTLNDSALKSSTLSTYATQSYVTGLGYATTSYVVAAINGSTTATNNAISALNASITGLIAGSGPKVTVLSGNCSINASSSCLGLLNTSTQISSGQIWNKSVSNGCTLNLSAIPISGGGNFSGWNVNGVMNTANPINITVSSDLFITAITSTGSTPIPTPTPTPTPTTHAPIINALTVDPPILDSGTWYTEVHCDAYSLEDDPLIYLWTSVNGSVSGMGDNVWWIKNASGTNGSISVKVSDYYNAALNTSSQVVPIICQP